MSNLTKFIEEANDFEAHYRFDEKSSIHLRYTEWRNILSALEIMEKALDYVDLVGGDEGLSTAREALSEVEALFKKGE